MLALEGEDLTAAARRGVLAERDSAAPPDHARSATDVVVELERAAGQAMFGFARRSGIDDEAAAEVVQEALLRLFDALRGGAQIHDPRAWAFRTAYRLAMDDHRRRSRALRLVERAGAMADPEAREPDPAVDEDRRAVWLEVDRLSERQRAVLYLRYRADLPFQAVGEILGITSSAARSHATQALAGLRRRLGEDR